MKICKIRIKGQKPTPEQLEGLRTAIFEALLFKGYKSFVYIHNSTHIKVSNVRLSDKFVEEFGYNIHQGCMYTKRRTRVLNFDQWRIVNHTINKVLDDYHVSANVSSLQGNFKIRMGLHKFEEDEWITNYYVNIGSTMYPVYRGEQNINEKYYNFYDFIKFPDKLNVVAETIPLYGKMR